MTTITISSPPDSRIKDDGLRFYTWAGKDYPSVTSVQRMAGIPHRLHQWAVSQVVSRAVGEVDTLTAMLTRERRKRERALESNRVAEASAWLRVAATEERDRSAAVGSAVHDAIATGLSPDDIPDVLDTLKDGKPVTVDGIAVRNRLLQFHDWRRRSGAEIVAQEFQVFDLEAGYAGTGDALVEFPRGRLALIDFKTGSSVFSEHAVQLRAYHDAEFSGSGDVVDERVTALLHGWLSLGILHIAEDHWEYLALRDDPEAGEAFRGLLRFASWMAAHADVETTIAGRRTNRTCAVCGETLLPQVTLRPVVTAGGVEKVATHPGCSLTEAAA